MHVSYRQGQKTAYARLGLIKTAAGGLESLLGALKSRAGQAAGSVAKLAPQTQHALIGSGVGAATGALADTPGGALGGALAGGAAGGLAGGKLRSLIGRLAEKAPMTGKGPLVIQPGGKLPAGFASPEELIQQHQRAIR